MKIWINRAGQNLGTFALEDVQRGLNQGQFVPTDLGWQEGMETWKPLAEFAGLQMPPPQQVEPAPLAPLSRSSPHVPPPLGEDTLVTVEGAEDGPAWERRKELGLVKALTETWKEVLFNPTVSFPRMKTNGGFAAPFLFNLTMMVIWGFFTTIYQLLLSGVFATTAGATHHSSTSLTGMSPTLPAFLNVAVMVVAIPLLVGFTFVNAGITHACLALFKGTSKSYEATYRVICYSYSAWIFAIVPCAGGIVSSIWSLVSTVIGLSKVHRTEIWRAAVAVLLPVFVCMGLIIALYVVIIAAVVTSLHHANT
jgi:hypothetical protein